jgi:hypothetical protein
MRIPYLLLMGSASGEKIIKNINIPSCINCIYFQPSIYDTNFASSLNKCNKFGRKDIITDEITHDYADSCRSDDSKCGEKGAYFEEEPNINLKILKHKIISTSPYITLITLVILNAVLSVKK